MARDSFPGRRLGESDRAPRLATRGPDLDLNFDAIEAVAFQAAQAVIKGTIQQSLSQQQGNSGRPSRARNADESSPWRPNHGNSSYTAPRVQYDEPKCHCPTCRRDFFPLSVPRCDLTGHGWSPSVLRKIVIAGRYDPWFVWRPRCFAGWRRSQSVAVRWVEITEEIGQEMAEKRDLKTNQFQDRHWPRRSLAFHGWLWSKWMGDGSSLEIAVLVLGRYVGILEGKNKIACLASWEATCLTATPPTTRVF